MRLFSFLAILLFLAIPIQASASSADFVGGKTCPSNKLFQRMFKHVCWDLVAGIEIMNVGGSKVPKSSYNKAYITCGDNLIEKATDMSITFGFWQPLYLIEASRRPMCMQSLFGLTLPISFVRTQGGLEQNPHQAKERTPSFYNSHEFKLPLLKMLELYTDMECAGSMYVDMDMGWISELNPLWNNTMLKLLVSWRSLVFAVPGVTEYCSAVDCPQANSDDVKDVKDNYFCSGCWGNTYPAVGFEKGGSLVELASKISLNLLTEGHEMGKIPTTMGKKAMCDLVFENTVPKDQYRFSLFSPKFNGKISKEQGCTFPIGQSSLLFGEDKWFPAGGEDFSMLVYSYTDCKL